MSNDASPEVVWTDYMKYRARLRGFDLDALEGIIRSSAERYRDTVTGRFTVVGRHGRRLILVAYERTEESIVPVTSHTTTRQQINGRLRSERYVYE